jgi:hypothetical protein
MKLWRGEPASWKWTPSHTDKGRLWLGFAGFFYLMAALALVFPSAWSGSGRWAWLHQFFAGAFGSYGDIVLFGVLGTACLLASLYYSRAPQ